jgi:hypothetical protein
MSGGRISEWILRTDNRSAIRGLREVAEQGNRTSRSLRANADENTASFHRVEESTSRLKDSFMGLAGVIGLGGVGFGLRDLKNSGVELQEQQVELQRALVATGQAAGGTGEKLKGYAESLSTKGGFGTTANLQALNAFVRITKSATEARKMLTLATDIARGRNMDLASSQNIVTQAYSGSVGRLQKVLGPMVAAREAQVGLTVSHQKEIAAIENKAAMMGPLGGQYLRQQEIALHLTAQQSALAEMTDKHTTAQKVLALATKEFSGATAAYSKTTAGQASNLSNSFHNLTEELGLALLPAMDWVIARAQSIAEWMSKNRGIVLGVAGAFAALAAALGLSALIKAVHGLYEDIGKLATQFLGMGTAGEVAGAETAAGAEAATVSWDAFFAGTLIGLGIMALVEIGLHWKQFEGLVVGAWHGVSSAVSSAWKWIENAVGTGVNWIWSKIKWLAGEAKKLIADTPLGGIIGFGSNLLGGHVGRAFGDLAQGYTGGIVQANGSIGAPLRNLGQNQGQVNVHIAPQTTRVEIDGREVARAVTRAVLNKAARGPSSYVGGSLVTNAPGLPG